MSERTSYAPGTPCWVDLATPDLDAAAGFYGELFGWKFRRSATDPYEHISADDKDIGGIVAVDASQAIPPHWIGYVATDDIDATLAAVTRNGGKVYVPKTDIPRVGQFAVAADPQGAMFSPFHYTGEGADQPEPSGPPGPYNFCWDELLSSDPAGAETFYRAVFGWEPEHLDMEKFGGYTLLRRPGVTDDTGGDKSAGGLMKLPEGLPGSFWLTYIAVENCDATVDKAASLGGKVLMPGTDIPGIGRFAAFLDPQGAAFSVLEPAPR